MTRNEAVLAILASAKGMALTPVQLQKAAFLLDKNVPGIVNQGQVFNFVPYDYGPFDKSVYDEAGVLAGRGLGVVSPAPYGRWYIYAATEAGVAEGEAILNSLSPAIKDYIERVTAWVRSQSFSSLVKSIYDQYPEMKANSVFQG